MGIMDVVSSQEDSKVSLETFSSLTGFPLSFIKKELLISDKEEVSLSDLRKSMLEYLNLTTNKIL